MLRRPPLSPYRNVSPQASPSSPPSVSSQGAKIALRGRLEGGNPGESSTRVPTINPSERQGDILYGGQSVSSPHTFSSPTSHLMSSPLISSDSPRTQAWRRAKTDIDNTRSASLRLGLEPMRLVDLEGSTGRRLPPATEPLVKYVPIERTHETTVIVRPPQPVLHDQSSSTSATSPLTKGSHNTGSANVVDSGTSPSMDETGTDMPFGHQISHATTVGTSPIRPAAHQSPIRASEKVTPDVLLSRADVPRSPPRGRIGAYAPHLDLPSHPSTNASLTEAHPSKEERLVMRLQEQQKANEDRRRELALLAFTRLVQKAAAFMGCDVPNDEEGDKNKTERVPPPPKGFGSWVEIQRVLRVWQKAMSKDDMSTTASDAEDVSTRHCAFQEHLYATTMTGIFGSPTQPPTLQSEIDDKRLKEDDDGDTSMGHLHSPNVICPIVGAHSLGTVPMCKAEIERLTALRRFLSSKQQRRVTRVPWRDDEQEAAEEQRRLATLAVRDSDEEDDSISSEQESFSNLPVTLDQAHKLWLWSLVSAPSDDEDPFYYYRCDYTDGLDSHADLDLPLSGVSEYVDCSARFGSTIGTSPFVKDSQFVASKCLAIVGYPSDVPLPTLFEALEHDYGIPIAALYRGAGWTNPPVDEEVNIDATDLSNPLASVVFVWVALTTPTDEEPLNGGESASPGTNESIQYDRITSCGRGNIAGALAVGTLPLRVPKWHTSIGLGAKSFLPFVECGIFETDAVSALAIGEAVVTFALAKARNCTTAWQERLEGDSDQEKDTKEISDPAIKGPSFVPNPFVNMVIATRTAFLAELKDESRCDCSVVGFLRAVATHTSELVLRKIVGPRERNFKLFSQAHQNTSLDTKGHKGLSPRRQLVHLLNSDIKVLSESAATLNALLTAFLSIQSHDLADAFGDTKPQHSNAVSYTEGHGNDIEEVDAELQNAALGDVPVHPNTEEADLHIRRVESHHSSHAAEPLRDEDPSTSTEGMISPSSNQISKKGSGLHPMNDDDILSIKTAKTSVAPTPSKTGRESSSQVQDSALKLKLLQQLRTIFASQLPNLDLDSDTVDDTILYGLFQTIHVSETLRISLIEPLTETLTDMI